MGWNTESLMRHVIGLTFMIHCPTEENKFQIPAHVSWLSNEGVQHWGDAYYGSTLGTAMETQPSPFSVSSSKYHPLLLF